MSRRLTYYAPIAFASPHAKYYIHPFEELLKRVERDRALAGRLLERVRYWQARGVYLSHMDRISFLVQVQNLYNYFDRIYRMLRDFVTGIRAGNMGLATRAYEELCRWAHLRPYPVWLTQLYLRLRREVEFTEMCLQRALGWYRGTIMQYVVPASTIAYGWWSGHVPLRLLQP